MADPLLKKHFPEKDLNQAVAVAAMCLQEEEGARPLMSDVVTALSFLSMVPPEVIPASMSPATLPPQDDGSEEEEEEEEEEVEQQDSDGTGGRSSRNSSMSWEEGSVSASKKSRNLSKKKSSSKDLKQKSSKKGGGKGSSRKSSRKSSRSRRMSVEWEEGGEGMHERGSSRMSQRDISFGLISSGGSSGGDDSDKGSTEGIRHRLPHAHTTKQPPKDSHRERLTASSAKV